MKSHAILAFALLAAGCNTYSGETSTAQRVTFTDGTSGSDVHRWQDVKIRTVRGSSTEFTGAVCTLRGSGFQTTFTTPATVSMPIYLGNTRPSSVFCTADGETRGASIVPQNFNSQYSGGTGSSLLSTIILNELAAQRDTSKDLYFYKPSYTVKFPAAL